MNRGNISFLRRSLLAALLLVLFSVVHISAAESGGACRNRKGGLEYTVRNVTDGDSIDVQSPVGKDEIRLWGIDAPEYDQPGARAAQRFLSRLLLNRKVCVLPHYRDEYGRLVARVFLKDVDVQALLVEEGMAWVHPAYCRKEVCQSWYDLQKSAEKSRRGLWRFDTAVPPWKWKRMKKHR